MYMIKIYNLDNYTLIIENHSKFLNKYTLDYDLVKHDLI
jgi:hypothetical protein